MILGRTVLGKGPSVGMIVPPAPDFKNVQASDNFMVF